MREGKKAYRDTHTSSKGNAWYAIRERNLAFLFMDQKIFYALHKQEINVTS